MNPFDAFSYQEDNTKVVQLPTALTSPPLPVLPPPPLVRLKTPALPPSSSIDGLGGGVPLPVSAKPSLSAEQQEALDRFKNGENVFISGPGGSGKSHLIHHLFQEHTRNPMQITSTTGCSSVLLSNHLGMGVVKTINSWPGIKLCKGDSETIIQSVLNNHYSVKTWKKIKTLIVDEVSMLSSKMFDILETLGRKTRKNSLPFGGIQVVFLGDMYQLPPVQEAGDVASGMFCFESLRWYDVFPRSNHISLVRIYRQQDATFQEILNQVRIGELSTENAQLLKNMIGRPYGNHNGIVPMRILPTRAQVNAVNETEYDKVTEVEHVFQGKLATDVRIFVENEKVIPQDQWLRGTSLSPQALQFESNSLKLNTPVEDCIQLKIGVPVMCLVNLDMETGIVNGSMGIVVDFVKQTKVPVTTNLLIPIVKFTNGIQRAMGIHTWQHNEYPNICYSQIPLCLSYSSTIHKLQGSTLDLAEMNLGGSVFADGQIYVGFSRVKTLDGLYLTAFHPNKIRVNEKVKAFYRGNLRFPLDPLPKGGQDSP